MEDSCQSSSMHVYVFLHREVGVNSGRSDHLAPVESGLLTFDPCWVVLSINPLGLSWSWCSVLSSGSAKHTATFTLQLPFFCLFVPLRYFPRVSARFSRWPPRSPRPNRIYRWTSIPVADEATLSNRASSGLYFSCVVYTLHQSSHNISSLCSSYKGAICHGCGHDFRNIESQALYWWHNLNYLWTVLTWKYFFSAGSLNVELNCLCDVTAPLYNHWIRGMMQNFKLDKYTNVILQNQELLINDVSGWLGFELLTLSTFCLIHALIHYDVMYLVCVSFTHKLAECPFFMLYYTLYCCNLDFYMCYVTPAETFPHFQAIW